MLFEKKFAETEHSQVRMGNGHVHFQGVRLNVYVFEVDGLLIDTGAQSLHKQFRPFFESIDVDKVIITHNHEDHTGGAAYLQQQMNLPIFINEMSTGACKQKANYPLYRQLFWGKRMPFEALPLGATFESRHAQWDVIATPGHAADHVALFNRATRQLFTGDLYVTPKTKVVLREESIPTTIASLQRVLTYEFDEVFCCHAGYVRDGRAALQQKLDYLLDLRTRIQTLREEGLSVQEISDHLFGKSYPIVRFSRGEWDSKHIVTSIINK